jgi:hypothetical protein
LTLSVSLGPLPVNEIKTLGLNFTVKESASKCSKNLLGLRVALRLTYIQISISVPDLSTSSCCRTDGATGQDKPF